MKYEIHSLKGAGPFMFGMEQDEVRRAAGGPFESFKRTPASAHPCDYFPDLGVCANYTALGRLEAVEFAAPARPMLDGESLLEIPFGTIKSILEKRDPGIEVESDSVISHKLGVSAYAPFAKEQEQARCESVMVFEAGYYD